MTFQDSPETLLIVVFVSFSLLLLNCRTPVVGVMTSSSVAFDVASHLPAAVTSQLPAEVTSESRSARQQSRSPGVSANWSPAARRRSQTAQRKQSTWKMSSRARMTRSLRWNGTEHAAHFAVNRLQTVIGITYSLQLPA